MKRTVLTSALLILLFLLAGCTAESEVCLVTFETDGAERSITSQKVMKGKNAEEPRNPEKENLQFDYWTLDGEEYDFSSPVTKDITLHAHYTPLYRITFDSDGGSYTPSDQLIKENGTVIEPRSPEKESSRGFMCWTDGNGTPYDFSSPVTSSFTLKAQYWPANIVSGGDPGPYDKEMNSVKDEVLSIASITDKLVSSSALMGGSRDFTEVFGDGNEKKDIVSGILRAALMQNGEVTIDGTTYTLSELTDYTVITDGCSIDKNTSVISFSDTTAGVTRYTVDITGLRIKVRYSKWDEENEVYRNTEESADIDIRGTVIKVTDSRYEEHITLRVNGKEYPVLHAVSTKTGSERVIFFVYRGLSTYFVTE